MSTPAKYFGGKTRLAPTIAKLLPAHRVYLEPFFGSGAVLFAKRPTPHEIVNDADANLVAFFRCLRDDPDELTRLCWLTPYARDEYMAALLTDEPMPDMERARRWWVRTQQGFGRIPTRSGWSVSIDQRSNNARAIANRVMTFDQAAQRLAGVTIEHRDVFDFVERFAVDTDSAIYLDPPYLDETRTAYADNRRPNGDYDVEFATVDEHERLLTICRGLPSSIVVSGYPSSLYESLLHDWRRIEINVARSSGHGRGNGESPRATEVLWCNFDPPTQGAFFT